MKLQAAVIFTSLQNAKFTFVAGYTSCRSTYIESFMTILGQCINACVELKSKMYGKEPPV